MKFLLLAVGIFSTSLLFACQHAQHSLNSEFSKNSSVLVYQYKLRNCNDSLVELPQKASSAARRIEAGYYNGPYCHGWTKYKIVTQPNSEPDFSSFLYAKLNSEKPCSLSIAVASKHSNGDSRIQANIFATIILPKNSNADEELSETYATPDLFFRDCRIQARRAFYKPLSCSK